MTIWSSEIKELDTLSTSLKGRFPELEKELEQLIKFDDANVILLYSRRCLEVIITDLCECELNRPRKTEPLKGIIDKLNREEKVPSNIVASMQSLNSLSTFGAHPKEFDPEQVKPVLNNLTTIIKWYLKYMDTRTISKPAAAAERYESEVRTASTEDSRIPKKRLILLLSGLVLVVVIVVVALFVFDIIGGGKQAEDLEKSIAVLPFKSLSDDPEKQYLADGMMDAILLHLSKIEDLRVLSRTSTEQYKESGKTMIEIGRELGVAYLLEGSFQKYGDDVRLIVQLIQSGKEGHVWANQYDRKWNNVFSVQSEVAQSIAMELYATITPEEIQLIEKVPTPNLTAYDYYLKAKDYQQDYSTAVSFYKAALNEDSTFAEAYSGWASIYWNKHLTESRIKEGILDSCLLLVNKALAFDDKLDEAYLYKGRYYKNIDNFEEALFNLDKALLYNPNNYLVYEEKESLLINYLGDYIKIIENYNKALGLIDLKTQYSILNNLGDAYQETGFIEKAKQYYREAFVLNKDTATYYIKLATLELALVNPNPEKAYQLIKIAYGINKEYLFSILYFSEFSGHNDEAFGYATKLVESGNYYASSMHRIGYAYWYAGKKKEAEDYIGQQIKFNEEEIKITRRSPWSIKAALYGLAACNAFLGNKEKAYQYLDEFCAINFFSAQHRLLYRNDPMFDSIRNEERFQKILQILEAQYQAEHERVGKWLEEQGML